jgi:ketosteroid isomerase-like protein
MTLALSIVAVPLTTTAADDGKSGALFDTIIAQDSALFAAFNTCDVTTLAEMVSDDLQFFHDHDGLSVGRDTFVQSVKRNVCGHFTRSLEPGSAEVWPVPGYGAVEIGAHRFHHADHSPDGIGRFMILWKQIGNRWVMMQSFSYGHMEAP